MRKRKFSQGVARFFNPAKSGTNEVPGVRLGTHQAQKAKETSYIPIYQGERPAHAYKDRYGQKAYR